MFNRSKLKKVLNLLIKNRKNYFSGELNNIIFLDFDGVINLDINHYTGAFNNKEQMENLNRFA